MGAIAAYYGGIWDAIIMRTADVFFAFPYILFAIVLIALLGKGFHNVFIAIGILGWRASPGYSEARSSPSRRTSM